MPEKAGTVEFKDFTGYLNWYSALTMSAAAEFSNQCDALTEEDDKRTRTDANDAFYDMFHFNGWQHESGWQEHRTEVIKRIKQLEAFATEFGQQIHCGQWESGSFAFLYIGNPKKGIIVPEPEKYLIFTPAKDYSGLTAAQVRLSLGTGHDAECTNLVPAEAEQSLTGANLKGQLSQQQSLLDELKKQMDDVDGAKTGELAELKREMQALQKKLWKRQEELRAELNQKKAEMEEQKEKLEGQIYLLDSQIYAIRCYAGEVVKFAKIRSGKNAADNEPIVIHQKLRYLDEDLGRLASLYEIQWEDIEMFESFLKHSPLALDTFAPNERCVMLVRLSRNAKQYGESDDYPYQNLLKAYNYYHGKTVGIIIRNGENVYLGWTEEERVHIDDDLIISQVITEIVPGKMPEFDFDSDRERYIKEQKAQRKQLLDGLVSRRFVYSILQGIVDNSSILPLPKGIHLGKQSEYVVYSVADKWLTDDKYGSFNSIVEKCNSVVSKGDTLLTVQQLVPERESHGYNYCDARWHNVRGRGEQNRTHDCSVDDCTLYPANVVEYDTPVPMIRYRSLEKPGYFELQRNPDMKPYWRESVIEKRHADTLMMENDEIIEEFDEKTRHVFVSVEKMDGQNSWDYHKGDKLARANFELHENEYINLTYMNSVWLEWVITNKSLGGWTAGGKAVDYAYAIRYLKTALDFIRKREAEERTLLDAIDPSICNDADWPVKLSAWKMDKGVRAITEYQAKRFAAQWERDPK